nr:putative transposase (putative), gypsy type [Tanacetum cinerariifolium]
MGTGTVQLETVVSTISQEYLLEFTSEYGISEALHPELPRPEDRIVDFPEGKYNRFFWVDERVFPTIVDWHTIAPKDGMPAENTYSPGKHTLYPNQETTRSTTLLGRIEPQILPGRRDMDFFNLICAPNSTKVKTGSRPRAAHEVPLLTVIANRSTGPEDGPGGATPDNVTTIGIAPEAGPAKRVVATGPLAVIKHRKRSHDGVDTNAPPKVLRRDHADPRSTESTRGEKSLAAIELGMRSTRLILVQQGVPVDVSDPDPLSFADPQSRVAAAEDPKSENTSFASMVGSLESIYRPEWGITNGCLLDVPEACQDLVDHIAPPGYFSELRHFHNDEFLKQYNVNFARQVAMGSQLRLRFEQEAKLLRKSVAQVARQNKRIQARENEIKNLETLLEVKTDMKRTAKNKGAELSTELETMRALFSDLQPCAEMDARLDALRIDFDEELYPHMLTAIAGRRCMIERGLRLAVMKCGESTELRQAFIDVVSAGIAKGMSEGLKHGVEHEKAKVDLEAIEAYDLEAEAKYIAALHALKNQMYPLVDQLESLKDAPMDVIMASLHLENDTGDDTPQWIRELRPTNAIAANISRAEKKKKYRVACRTHEVGSAHHAQFDGILVSLPTVAHQGLAILLVDAVTQTQTSDEAYPQLLRSSSLPVIHG